jgi:steroid 5-alpha reductase family enzyme
MKNADRIALIAPPIIILLGAGMAWAGSQGGAALGSVPLFALCVGLIFTIQWLAFIPAYLLQTEKFFDLTGSLTYTLITLLALGLAPVRDARAFLLAGMVIVWALRLGIFLFRRVKRAGKDARFDEIKPSFLRFLNVWNIQGLWVTLTLAAALAAITATKRVPLDGFALAGVIIWLLGFAIEVIADAQKSRFKADPANAGKFIRSGLWAHSRHPNYFGEILLWFGVALVALPTLEGWRWVTLISPFFVAFLLLRVSGVPLLEKRADEKWGGQPEYETYKKNTPSLIPRWPSKKGS